MQVPEAAIILAKRFEGCRLTAYKDSVGRWTIGYGDAQNVHPDETMTQEYADALLIDTLQKAAQSVRRLITVPLSDNQLASLTDFTYNLGSGTLQRSTLRQKLNRKEYYSIPNEILKYNTAGGKVLAGLVLRRQCEAALFRAL